MRKLYIYIDAMHKISYRINYKYEGQLFHSTDRYHIVAMFQL